MKKKIIFVLLCIVLLFVPDRYVFAQDIDLQAPTVQYKLNNHDSISLKWNSIDGADAYYIYRKDTKTGKKIRYTMPVCDTETTINNLSAETEYVFSVAPIKKNGNKVKVGKASSGTKLTTPKEWYYYCEHEFYRDKDTVKKVHFYRENYSGSIKEEIKLGDIITARKIFSHDGWIYVIGYYDAIAEPESFKWNGSNEQCIIRIKADGTQKELLCRDLVVDYELDFYYWITDDALYLSQICHDYEENRDNEGYYEREYLDEEYCWLKKISLKTGEVTTIASPCLFNWIEISNSITLYEYEDIYTYSEYNPYLGTKGTFISAWMDNLNGNSIDYEKIGVYFYWITDDGNHKPHIYKHKFDKRIYYGGINDEIIAFQEGYTTIYTLSLDDHKLQKIYTSNARVHPGKITNDYIYFSEIKGKEAYCRIKADGTGLEKQDKPFEWFY